MLKFDATFTAGNVLTAAAMVVAILVYVVDLRRDVLDLKEEMATIKPVVMKTEKTVAVLADTLQRRQVGDLGR
mgnify:CR=1 FL=1